MVGDGLLLMVLGISVVFVFLTLLYGATSLFARVVSLLPEPVVATPKSGGKSVAAPAAKSGELVAVVSAAIAAHRRSK